MDRTPYIIIIIIIIIIITMSERKNVLELTFSWSYLTHLCSVNFSKQGYHVRNNQNSFRS